MISRKIWAAFLILIALILGASYSYLLNAVTTLSNQYEIDSNQRLAEKADGNLNAIESLIRENQIEKAKLLLKAIGKGERVACVSLKVGDQTFSSPDPCDVSQSDRTLVIGSESGMLIKMDTGLTLVEELSAKLNRSFFVLGISLLMLLFLFSLLASLAIQWSGQKSFFFKRIPDPSERSHLKE